MFNNNSNTNKKYSTNAAHTNTKETLKSTHNQPQYTFDHVKDNQITYENYFTSINTKINNSLYLPKEYISINMNRPSKYWDYENLEQTLKWNPTFNYECIKKIGRGKYSEVFYGQNNTNHNPCCLKILKPVKKKKIFREISILSNLSQKSQHIIQLLDYVRESPHMKPLENGNATENTPTLIFEYLPNTCFFLNKELNENTVISNIGNSTNDIQLYLYQLLLAINICHSNGIIHRDIKPQNTIINQETKILKLIDFGLAEYYHPMMKYNVRVASRYFKSPELLLGQGLYHYSLDMWSYGCLMAGLMFNIEPFFKGVDNNDQIIKIAKVLGTDELFEYLSRYDLKLDSINDVLLGRYARKPWNSFKVCNDGSGFYALDLIDNLLKYDQQKRLSSSEALLHPYFKNVAQVYHQNMK